MLSRISSLVGGDGVFSMLHQAATSVVSLALHGLAKALIQGGHRLGALISNPTAKAKGQQEIDLLLNITAESAAHALNCALQGRRPQFRVFLPSLPEGDESEQQGWEPEKILSNQRRSDEALTELKSDLKRMGLPNSNPQKMDMAEFLKKHVDRKP